MTALKSMRFCLGMIAAIAFLPAIAGAQTAPWASDQSAADADMANGQYQDAAALYERAIATAESGRPDAATKAQIGKMLVNEGNCYLKLHRTADALAAYEKAAPLSANPGNRLLQSLRRSLQHRQYGRRSSGLRQGDPNQSEQGGRLFHQRLAPLRAGADRQREIQRAARHRRSARQISGAGAERPACRRREGRCSTR